MKIELTQDVLLRGPVWADSIDRLVGPFFKTNWDLFSLCVAIGMMYDEQVESDALVPEGYEAEPRYIPRNVLGHAQNLSLMELMVQSALITTKHLTYNEEERLELAFGDKMDGNFRPVVFLTKYANSGILKLNPLISDTDNTETMEAFMTFLDAAYAEGVNAIDDHIELSEDF